MSYIKFLMLIPFLTLFYQLYSYAERQKGVERQNVCRSLGIASFTIGVVCLVFRDLLLAIFGIIFMMFGFRLIAHGLDRIDKKIFIDRYVDETEEK
jgi:Na+/phosphate symporter